MRRLRGPARWAVVAAGVVLAASPVVLHRAPAHADTPGSGLGGYRVSSGAGGFEFLYNDGSEAQATFPEAQSSASVGSGHALATVFYPGPPGESPGPTIQQFAGADLPAPVVAAAGQVNNPVKAEAYDSGPNDANFPTGGSSSAFDATAHALAGDDTATGTFAGGAGMKSAAVSTTKVAAATVTTTATGTVSDLTLAAVVHVGQVVSTATATSDGTTAKAAGSTVFSGFTIGGLAVNLDAKGVTLGPSHLPITATAVLDPAVKALGITVTQIPATQTISGAHAVEHASAVEIDFAPPQNGGNTFTVLLGGAQADALATAPFDSSLPASTPPVAAVTPTDSGSNLPTAVTPSPTGVNLAPTSDSGSAFAPTTTPKASGGGSGGGGIVSQVPAAQDYKGIAAGLLAFGLLVGVAGAFGLGKVPDDVLAEKVATSACPLERSRP